VAAAAVRMATSHHQQAAQVAAVQVQAVTKQAQTAQQTQVAAAAVVDNSLLHHIRFTVQAQAVQVLLLCEQQTTHRQHLLQVHLLSQL
jgi:hypothetical protein